LRSLANILEVLRPIRMYLVASLSVPGKEPISQVSALPKGLFGRLVSSFQTGTATVTRNVPGPKVIELEDPRPEGCGSTGHTFRHKSDERTTYRRPQEFRTFRTSVWHTSERKSSETSGSRGTEFISRHLSRSLTPKLHRNGAGCLLDLMMTGPVNNFWVLVARPPLVKRTKLTEEGSWADSETLRKEPTRKVPTLSTTWNYSSLSRSLLSAARRTT